MTRYEFRSQPVEHGSYGAEKVCNEWAKDGWEVFSIICPNPDNYNTFVVTAKRQVSVSNPTGRRFR